MGMERPWQDEETLWKLYAEEGLTTTEIGEKLDCGEGTVWRWMDRHDISRRNRGPKREHTHLSDPTWLRDQYEDAGKTAYEIADELDCSPENVYYWMNKHGIETRSAHNGQLLTDKRLADKSWIRKRHYDEHASLTAIARECGVSPSAIVWWMDKHGLEYQSTREEYYGPNWDEQRLKRREYDNNECVICGMQNAEHTTRFGKGLHCHHIKPLKEFREGGEIDFEAANSIENLITLCIHCHKKWEGIPLRPQKSE